MKKKSTSRSAFFNLRILVLLVLFSAGISLAVFATSATGRTHRGEGNPFGLGLVPSHTAIPFGGNWTVTGSLNTARVGHTATLLPNGMVLVAAGGSLFGAQASAELYDPASENWTATGNLNTAREGATATLLPDGMVLVAAGLDSKFNALASAEVYDPASGSWTVTGNLNTAREEHAAASLPNGMVLVAGGLDSKSNALASAELYDPASGSWAATGNTMFPRRRCCPTAWCLSQRDMVPII